MSLAINSDGTLYLVGDGAGTEAFTPIPGVARVNFPDVKTDLQDVTDLQSPGGFREFLPGLKDGDSVNSEMYFVPWNGVHRSLRIDGYAANKRNFQLYKHGIAEGFPNMCAFAAYISSLAVPANVGEPIKCSMSTKVTGEPVWSEVVKVAELTRVYPATGARSATNLKVQLFGVMTSWVQGVTTASFGANITVNSVTVLAGNVAVADITIDAGAATGLRGVTVTTGGEVVTKADSFNVT